jgi:hypothetical protein
MHQDTAGVMCFKKNYAQYCDRLIQTDIFETKDTLVSLSRSTVYLYGILQSQTENVSAIYDLLLASLL